MHNKQPQHFHLCFLQTFAKRMAQVALGGFAILIFAQLAFAQTNTGQIKGVLRDHNGAVVPGANVMVTNIASSLSVARVSDSSGEFVFPSLAVGDWTMSVMANGFKQLRKSDINLRLGQVIDLELQLEIGDVTINETVNVTAAGQILQRQIQFALKVAF